MSRKFLNAPNFTVQANGLNSWFNVKDPAYGAKGDGSTDDTTAIQAALTAANSAGGGVVYMPHGSYKRSGAGWTLYPNVTVTGDDRGNTTIIQSDDHDVFSYPVPANNILIQKLTIQYTGITSASVSTPSTHAAFKFGLVTTSANIGRNNYIQYVNVLGMGIAIYMPWLNGTSVNEGQYAYCNFEHLLFESCNMGLLLNGFSDFTLYDIAMDNIFGQNPHILEPLVAPINNTTASPQASWNAVAQNFINDLGNSNMSMMRVYGGVGVGWIFQDCITSHVYGLVSANTNTHGVLIISCSLEFNGSFWRVAVNGASGVVITTDSNAIENVHLFACKIDSNQNHGIFATPVGSGAITKLHLTDCSVTENGKATSNTYDGVNFQGSELFVKGGTYNDMATSETQRYGINSNTAGTTNINVLGACLTPNVTGPYSNAAVVLTVLGCEGTDNVVTGPNNTFGNNVTVTGTVTANGNAAFNGTVTAARGVQATAGPLATAVAGSKSAISTTETVLISLPLITSEIAVNSSFTFNLWASFAHGVTGGTTTFTIRAGTTGTTADTSIGTVALAGAASTGTITTQIDGQLTVTASGSSGTANIGLALSQSAAQMVTGLTSVAAASLTSWNTTTATFLTITVVTSSASNTYTQSQAHLQQVK